MSESGDLDSVLGRRKTSSVKSTKLPDLEKSTKLPDLEKKTVTLGPEEELQAPIRRLLLTPREKYDMPMTSQMAYGWFALPDKISKNFSRWRRPLIRSEISIYSDSYCRLTGIAPCVRKLNSANALR